MNVLVKLSALVLLLTLSACGGSDPGALAGKWRTAGVMPIVIEFRSGETESMGMIDKVSYEIKGSDILVSSKEGIMKGTTFRYTMTGPNSARTDLFTMQRIE